MDGWMPPSGKFSEREVIGAACSAYAVIGEVGKCVRASNCRAVTREPEAIPLIPKGAIRKIQN
jgi:hypothetical protein